MLSKKHVRINRKLKKVLIYWLSIFFGTLILNCAGYFQGIWVPEPELPEQAQALFQEHAEKGAFFPEKLSGNSVVFTSAYEQKSGAFYTLTGLMDDGKKQWQYFMVLQKLPFTDTYVWKTDAGFALEKAEVGFPLHCPVKDFAFSYELLMKEDSLEVKKTLQPDIWALLLVPPALALLEMYFERREQDAF